MGSIPCVQMVLNLDPSSSPTHTRFDLSPFTSFQPLPLFASLPHYRFWSSEDPATLTTTRAPSFISTLIFRTFSQNRNTDQAAALVGSPCEHNPKASSDQLQNVSSSVCECGDSHHKSSALRLTPQFEAGPPETPNLRYRVTRGLTFWWLSIEHLKTATRYRPRVPRRPYQDTLILPGTETFPYSRSTSAPGHCQKRSSDGSLVFPSDSMLWRQSEPPAPVLR